MSELDATLATIDECIATLQSSFTQLRKMFSANQEQLEEAGPELTDPEPVPPVEAPKVAIEDVRAALLPLVNGGHHVEVRKLLRRHGADRLTQIDPAEYEAIIAEAGEIT